MLAQCLTNDTEVENERIRGLLVRLQRLEAQAVRDIIDCFLTEILCCGKVIENRSSAFIYICQTMSVGLWELKVLSR